LEWSSPSSCSECVSGKVLFGENGQKICKDLNLVVDFCQSLAEGSKNNSLSYKCGACEPDYYLEDGKCKSRPENTLIQNCENYVLKETVSNTTTSTETTTDTNTETNTETNTDTETNTETTDDGANTPQTITDSSTIKLECALCSQGHLLSEDKTSCTAMPANIFSSHCKSGIRLDSPKCGFCGLGLLLDEKEECVSCGGEGCGICNLGNLGLCRACNSGYYMDTDFTCVKMDAKDLLYVDQDVIVVESKGVSSWLVRSIMLLWLVWL
jgi:hypothetical protein